MPTPSTLDLTVGLSIGRTHQRTRWEEHESRLIDYIVNDFATELSVGPLFPEIQSILQKVEVPKASFMRRFPAAMDFKLWAFRALIENVPLYATDKVCAEIVVIPSDVHMPELSNRLFLTRTRRAIVTLTNHVRAIRVEQAAASLGNHDGKAEINRLLMTAQYEHVSAIALRLESQHKWFHEQIVGDDDGGYASALFDAARGFALSPFGTPTEDIQEVVFSSIAARYVRPM